MSEQPEAISELDKERFQQTLHRRMESLERSGAENDKSRDNYVYLTATGALGLSMTTIKSIVPDPAIHDWLLIAAWVSLAMSICFGIVAFVYESRLRRLLSREITAYQKYLDRGEYDSEDIVFLNDLREARDFHVAPGFALIIFIVTGIPQLREHWIFNTDRAMNEASARACILGILLLAVYASVNFS